MRVLHIVTAFPRGEGDVITPWLVEMLRGLKGRGIDVEVFTSSYKGLGRQVLYDIPVHRFRYFPRRWENLTHEEMTVDRLGRSPRYKILPIFYLMAGSLAAWRLCRKNQYDVVHVHWPLPHALFGWIAQKACGANLVTTFYGAEVRWAKHSRLPLLRSFLAWAAKVSDRVTAISTYTKNEVRSIAEVPVEVIPYTIGFSQKTEGKRQKSEGGRRTILTVGRLVERKGIRYLIDAMRLLPEKLKAELVVIGGGPLRKVLEDYAKVQGVQRMVRFAGKVSEEELSAYYRSASVYVQPAIVDSRGDTEMLGVVMLEAMYYGVPVVASQVGGIPDVVQEGETGLLVPEKNPKALALAIEKLLSDRKMAGMMAAKAKKQICDNFSWNNILDNIIKAYNKL